MDIINQKKVSNFINSKKFDKALKLCQKAIKINSNDDIAHMLLGLTYFSLNKLDLAKQSLELSKKLNPNSVAALNNLNLVYSKLGNYKQAISVLKQALKIDPMNKAMLQNLAQTHYQFGSFHQAAFQYKSNRLLGITGRDIDNSIVDCLEKAHEHAEALAEIEEIEEKSKQIKGNEQKSTIELLGLNIFLLKGELLIKLGRKREVHELISAIDIQNLALEHKVRLGDIYKLLGESQTTKILLSDVKINKHIPPKLLMKYLLVYKVSEPDLNLVEKYIKSMSLDNIDYYYLSINLAKQFKRFNNLDKHKYWLIAANSKMKGEMSNPDHISILDKIMDTVNGIDIPYSNCDSTQPIFIVGMPRSGTTLLESMLAVHTDVHSGGELKVFTNALNKLSPPLENVTVLEQSNRYLNVINQLSTEDLNKVANEYISKAKGYVKPGAKYIVDKYPHNFTVLGVIHKVLPKAKIIYIKRNPISICFSIYEQSFNQYHDYRYDLNYLADYYLKFKQMMDFWLDYLPEGTVYQADYDKLIANPNIELTRLFNYLELEKPENVLDFYKSNDIVTTASTEQVRQPLYNKENQSWEHMTDAIQPLIKKLSHLI